MKQFLRIVSLVFAVILVQSNAAQAWHISGFVFCDANGSRAIDEGDLPLANVVLTVNGVNLVFTGSATSDATGRYRVNLPDVPGSFTITLTAPDGATVILQAPNPFPFGTTDDEDEPEVNWLVSSEACEQAACWLTGGGAKFSNVLGITVAEKGPQHNFGGNVNPSCDPDPGEGGQWNHLAHGEKKHFQGLQIRVVRCGNVPGIPPGSSSPATPFNFIEFEGTGVLKGVAGNKEEYGPVNFFGRAEDRNEPGSSGAKDGAQIDRYYLRVWDSATLVQRLLVDDGAGSPVPITNGNLQIHISSCAAK